MNLTAYLLGPMTGYPDHNHPAFHHWAKLLRGIGYTTLINPAELDETHGKCPTLEDYYARDIMYLRSADVGIAMPGWQESRGATGEAWILGVYLKRPILQLPDLHELTLRQLPRLCLEKNN